MAEGDTVLTDFAGSQCTWCRHFDDDTCPFSKIPPEIWFNELAHVRVHPQQEGHTLFDPHDHLADLAREAALDGTIPRELATRIPPGQGALRP